MNGITFDVTDDESRRQMEEATEKIKTKSPLYKHVLMNHYNSLSGNRLSPEVRRILEDGSQATTVRRYHSEENRAMSELLLVNCRDTRLEKCLDSVVSTPYMLKQSYQFCKTPSDAGFMLTSHLTQMTGLTSGGSGAKRYCSSEFSYLKNAATPTQCLLKNCVRYLRYTDSLCDAINQSTTRGCSCAFTYHHDPPSGGLDEFSNPETLYLDRDFTPSEIRDNPYLFHVKRSAKNYALYRCKINPKQRGDTLLASVKRLAQSGMGSAYERFFVAERDTVEQSALRPAGVNLNVVATPSNLKSLLSRANCFAGHVCLHDLLATTAVSYGEVLNAGIPTTKMPENLDLAEIAIPPNLYVQHSAINPSLIFFSNTLVSINAGIMNDIKNSIVSELESVDGAYSLNRDASTVSEKIEEALKSADLDGLARTILDQQRNTRGNAKSDCGNAGAADLVVDTTKLLLGGVSDARAT